MTRRVRDDPLRPDPGFAELYGRLPEATRLEPWLGWCGRFGGPVLYLGVGAGRLAGPLARAGVSLVGVDSHPGMLERAASRLRGGELVLSRVEELDLGRRFPLVIAPSNLLHTTARLLAAARHMTAGGAVGLELLNPHWLAAGARTGVRVKAMDARAASLEVEYPGGFVEIVERLDLIWPERAEEFLSSAGLRLERMEGEGTLAESPTYCLLASRRLRKAQIPST